MNNTNYKSIEVSPISGALGAIITGVELKNPHQDTVFAEVYRAFLEYKVIFFNDQELSPETQLRVGRLFGKPILYPFVKGLKDFREKKRTNEQISSSCVQNTMGLGSDSVVLPRTDPKRSLSARPLPRGTVFLA